MINNATLIGRLTRDPEVRKTSSGKSVCSFTLAVDNSYAVNGNRTASFIPCTAWGVVADNLARFCGKGSLIAVEGRIQQRSYDSNSGNKVSVVEIVASQVEFLERRNAPSNDSYGVDAPISDDSIGLDPTADDEMPF